MRRSRASRLDCLGEEEEGKEAELLPQLDLLQEVLVDAGERRRLVQLTAIASFRVRVRCRGKKEGKREQRVVGVLLILHEGQGARGCVGDEGEGSVATAMASLQGEDDGIFAGNPLAAFSFSVFFI